MGCEHTAGITISPNPDSKDKHEMLIENTTLYNLGTQTIDLTRVQVVEDPRSFSDPDFPVPKKFGFIVYLGTYQITTDYLSLAAATTAHCEFHKAWVKVKTLPKPLSLEASSSSYTYVSEGHYHYGSDGSRTFIHSENEDPEPNTHFKPD